MDKWRNTQLSQSRQVLTFKYEHQLKKFLKYRSRETQFCFCQADMLNIVNIKKMAKHKLT